VVTSKQPDNAIDCTFRSEGPDPLELELPTGVYEIKPIVPDGLCQFRPGPAQIEVREGETQAVEFTFVAATVRGPRSEYRDRETRPNLSERIATGLGWRPKRVVVITPAVGHGGSYHFEAKAPEGLFVSRAALIEDSAVRTTWSDEAESPLALDTNRERVHLAAPALPQDYSAIVILKLRPRPWTIIRPACLSAIFTTCVLFAIARRWPSIGTNAGAVATLLLVVPGGLSAWAARSQENAVTTEVLFGLRMLSLTAGLWAFLGAATLVLNRAYDANAIGSATLGQPWRGTEAFLWTLFGLSAITSLVLAVAWLQATWLAENRGRMRTRSRSTAAQEGSA
jgi:hypothetical protein